MKTYNEETIVKLITRTHNSTSDTPRIKILAKNLSFMSLSNKSEFSEYSFASNSLFNGPFIN